MTDRNIALIGFGKLEPTELEAVNKILETHEKRLWEQANYESLRLTLNSHQRARYFIHEIKAEFQAKKGKGADSGREIIISASSSGKNMFSVLTEVLKMLASEARHRLMTSRETGKEMLRNQKKNRFGKGDFS
jgi:hypothetical protein